MFIDRVEGVMNMSRLVRFILISLFLVVIVGPVHSFEPSWEYRPATMSTLDEICISRDNTIAVGGDSVYFLSPDGKKLWGGFGSERIIISNDNRMMIMSRGPTIKAIDLNGILLWEDTMDCPIVDMAASENGSIIVAIDQIGNSLLWRDNGNRIRTIRSNSPQRGHDIAISHDGEQIIGATSTKIFSAGKYIWNINYESHPGFFPITDITVNPRGDAIVMAGGKWLYFWEGREGEIVNGNRLMWNRDIINGNQLALAISDDGSTIVVGSDDNKIYVVDRNGSLLWTNTTGYWVRSVAVTSDGEYILAGSFDSHLFIFDHLGNSLATFRAGRPVWSIALSPDESLLVIATDEAVIGFKDWKADLPRDTDAGQNSDPVSVEREEVMNRSGPPQTQTLLPGYISLGAVSVLGLIFGVTRKGGYE